MKVYQGLSELQLKIQLFQDIIKKVIFIKRRRKMAEYKLLKTEGRAKRAEFHTVHGTIQTPVFMNVGTIGAIKGAVSTMDLQQIGTQVELSNTYHLHVRPGAHRRRERTGHVARWHEAEPVGASRCHDAYAFPAGAVLPRVRIGRSVHTPLEYRDAGEHAAEHRPDHGFDLGVLSGVRGADSCVRTRL